MIQVDRSRILSYQRCPRRRYLEYHAHGKGIQRVQKSLPLVFGSAFHEGTELMLAGDIEGAVLRAQLYLSNIFADHGVSFDREEMTDPEKALLYGAEEQGAMAEALLRGFWVYEGETLLEGFEVLEVEREGRAVLTNNRQHRENMIDSGLHKDSFAGVDDDLILMFRPDALVRERSTGDLYVISWKTCSTFGPWTLRQCRTDMQSMSEVFGLQQQYRETALSVAGGHADDAKADFGDLRIEGVLYKFAVKSQRRKDNWDGLYKQGSHLIYGWKKLGRAADETDWSWSYEYPNEEDPMKTSRLGKGWQKVPIWREYPGGVKAWIEGLAGNEIFPRHTSALAAAFPAAMPVSRRADEINQWRRQIVAQELKVQESLERVETADRLHRHLVLDEEFPQYTHSCEDYSGCPMWDVCWTPAVGEDPIGSGLYQIRTETNHPEDGEDE